MNTDRQQYVRYVKHPVVVVIIILGVSLPAMHGTGLADLQSGFSPVPATYYGALTGDSGFAPTAEMPVMAVIDGNQCGGGTTQQVDDQAVYSVNVVGEGPGGVSGCGAAGRIVLFRVASVPMAPIAIWDPVVTKHPLAPMQPPLAPSLFVGRAGNDVSLTWTEVTRDTGGRATLVYGYDVWVGADPYFDPTEPNCGCAALTRTTGLTYPHEDTIGDKIGLFYLIQAVNPAGASATSNRVGEFEIVLVPGK